MRGQVLSDTHESCILRALHLPSVLLLNVNVKVHKLISVSMSRLLTWWRVKHDIILHVIFTTLTSAPENDVYQLFVSEGASQHINYEVNKTLTTQAISQKREDKNIGLTGFYSKSSFDGLKRKFTFILKDKIRRQLAEKPEMLVSHHQTEEGW